MGYLGKKWLIIILRIITVFRNNKLYIGHVGDSAVIRLSDEQNAKMLTHEHKPDEERSRIESMDRESWLIAISRGFFI